MVPACFWFFVSSSVGVLVPSPTLVYILILAIYVALIGVLGFLISSLLLSAVTMLWQKVRSWKQWAVSIAMAFIVYFAFTEGLGITFPTFLG